MTYDTHQSIYGHDAYREYDMTEHAYDMADRITLNEFSSGGRVLKSGIGGDCTSRLALSYTLTQFANYEFDYEDDPYVSHFSSLLQKIATFLEEAVEGGGEDDREGFVDSDRVVDDESVDRLINDLFKGLVSWSMTRHNESERERESEKAAIAHGVGIRINLDDPIQSRDDAMEYVVAIHRPSDSTSIYRREEDGAYTRFLEEYRRWSSHSGLYPFNELHDVRVATYADLLDRGISLGAFYETGS